MNGELGLLTSLSNNKRVRQLVDENREDLDLLSSRLISIIDDYNRFLSGRNYGYFQKSDKGRTLSGFSC